MIGNLIRAIQDMAEQVAPYAVFECDEVRMINVKVDTVTRKVTVIQDGVEREVSNSFIYVEEPTYGFYDFPYRGFNRQRTPIRIYFCKFEEMHASAWKGTSEYSENEGGQYRVPLRDEIEETMVRPFLYLLKQSYIAKKYPDMIASIRVLYPRPRFDANEVSVGLELTLFEDICIDDYTGGDFNGDFNNDFKI